MTSAELVRLLQETPQLKGKKIGALDDLSDFADVAHVVYVVNVRDGSEREPVGDCACLVIAASNVIGLELSTSLHEFWNYWERQRKLDFTRLSVITDEIVYFFKHREPREKSLYRFRGGEGNTRLHRTARSIEKCDQLRKVFGFQLVASEF